VSSLLLCLLGSCSTHEARNKSAHSCLLDSHSTEQEHIIISAKSQGGSFISCFQNYLRFEKEKKQTVHVCHALLVEKSGKVTYSKVSGINERVPNDFRLCLEQSLWIMNFKSLQLSGEVYLQFPIKYESL